MIEATTDLLAEALFVCDLQPSQRPCADAIRNAITHILLHHGGPAREGTWVMSAATTT